MGDRFLDDNNIKVRPTTQNPQLQATLIRARQLRDKVKSQVDSLEPTELAKLTHSDPINIKETVQQIQEKLDIPEEPKKTPKKKRVSKKASPVQDMSSNFSQNVSQSTSQNMPNIVDHVSRSEQQSPNIPFNQQITLAQLPDDAKISHSLSIIEGINNESDNDTLIHNNIKIQEEINTSVSDIHPPNTNLSKMNLSKADIEPLITNTGVNNNLVNQFITNYVRENQEPDLLPLDTPNADISNIQIKSQDEAISKDKLYEQEVNKILQQNPELVPKPSSGLNVQLDMSNYIVTKEQGKVKVETKSFREMNKKIGPQKLDRDILLEKQKENELALEIAKVELEIYSKMISISNDDSLRLNLKLADWQKKLKEAELRRSAITNILTGR